MVSLLFCGRAAGANAPVITHGPLLGEVTSTSVRVWARTNEPATIEFRYGKDSASLEVVQIRFKPSQAMTSPVGQPFKIFV